MLRVLPCDHHDSLIYSDTHTHTHESFIRILISIWRRQLVLQVHYRACMTHIYIYIYICVCVCMYVCIYTHKHTYIGYRRLVLEFHYRAYTARFVRAACQCGEFQRASLHVMCYNGTKGLLFHHAKKLATFFGGLFSLTLCFFDRSRHNRSCPCCRRKTGYDDDDCWVHLEEPDLKDIVSSSHAMCVLFDAG